MRPGNNTGMLFRPASHSNLPTQKGAREYSPPNERRPGGLVRGGAKAGAGGVFIGGSGGVRQNFGQSTRDGSPAPAYVADPNLPPNPGNTPFPVDFPNSSGDSFGVSVGSAQVWQASNAHGGNLEGGDQQDQQGGGGQGKGGRREKPPRPNSAQANLRKQRAEGVPFGQALQNVRNSGGH